MNSLKKNILYRILKSFYFYLLYLRDYFAYRKLDKGKRFKLGWSSRMPMLYDRTARTTFDRHYVYHTAWAARKVREIKPDQHIDISSSLYFSAIASAFVPIRFYDYRPADLELDNFSTNQADLLKLPFSDNSVDSLSCMHVLEHVGLGRYGDPLDPEGDLKAIAELKRAVAVNGNLLIVVPIGKPAIRYNAHRIYSYEMIIEYFDGLKLKEFSLIKESGQGIIKDAVKELADAEEYGCGCFWFTN